MFDNDLSGLFAEQFTLLGDRWVFRARQKGAAIPVTADEKELFVTGFEQSQERFQRIIRRLMLIGLVALLTKLWISSDGFGTDFVVWFVGLVTIAAWANALHSIFALNVPKMALFGRTPLDVAVQPSDGFQPARNYGLSIWPLPVMFLINFGNIVRTTHGPPDAFDTIWPILAGALALMLLFQELRQAREAHRLNRSTG